MKRACKTAALLASCLFLLCGMQPAAFSAAGAGTGETYRKEVPSSSFADEYTSYAEDGNLELLVNEARCLLLLRDNATGAAYPLTPDDADGDAIASKAGIEEMKSHLNILYSGDDGVEKTMSSYADCVAKAQYRLFSLADGVRVEYTLGTPPDQRMILPLQMTVEAYADITGFYAQEEKTLKRLQYFYSLVSLSVVQNDAQRKELLAAYPVLEKQDIYVARTMSEKERKELEGYFQAAGFTLERVDKLYEELGFAEERGSKPYFIIPVDYTLGDGVFAVEIASQEIRRNEDYYLETMTLLQYFGARKEESGYIFIPDGSGSLVRFGEGTKHTKLYMTGKVYGDDVGVEQTTDTVCFRLPVFGVKGEDSALFANITKGAAGAQITAQAGGIVDAYYTAYATFTYHNKYVYVLSNGDVEQKNWPVFAAESNTDPCRVEYTLLTGDRADVGGMAAAYSRFLFGEEAADTRGGGLPLYLTTLGMINEEENLLGISYDADRVLTTFDDVRAIVEDLKKSGVAAVTVQMTGWYNGGLNYTAPAKIDVDGLLGGEKGLRNLLGAYAADDSVQVYPSFDLGFVMRTAIFDGFSGVRDAARTMEGKLSTKKSIDLAVNKLEETGRLVINSQSAARYAAAVRRFLDENGGGGVSLQGIGSDVFGSYKKGGFVRRESAVEAYRGLLEKQAAAGPVLVESGNAYALPFATDVLSLPYGDSGYPNYGERVAFVQMVLHGQVGYGIAPINLSEDVELQILRCIETGASPAFTIARRNISALRGDAFYNKYYAVDYSVLADTIADSYRQVSSVLGRVGGCRMTGHQQLADKVFCTSYDNGVRIYVNYGDGTFTDGATGTVVGPRSFAVLEQGEEGR